MRVRDFARQFMNALPNSKVNVGFRDQLKSGGAAAIQRASGGKKKDTAAAATVDAALAVDSAVSKWGAGPHEVTIPFVGMRHVSRAQNANPVGARWKRASAMLERIPPSDPRAHHHQNCTSSLVHADVIRCLHSSHVICVSHCL
jgi:hypothetical protein